MKKLSLNPNRIIMPGEYDIGNMPILKIYDRIYSRRKEIVLPPVIVTTLGDTEEIKQWLEKMYQHWERPVLFSNLTLGTLEGRRKDYEQLFEKLASAYLLLDGNHRSISACLNHRKVSALEVNCDKDLEEIRRMVECGELFNFNREETSLHNLRREFVAYCLSLNIRESDDSFTFCDGKESQLKYIKTVEERVQELVENKDIPDYMIAKYLGEGK